MKAPYIRYLLQAAKRKKKVVRRKDQVISKIMRFFARKFMDSGKLANLRGVAMSMGILCFAGFLRFNEVSALQAKDLKVFPDYLTLNIQKSKTDQYRDGHMIYIAKE